VGEVKTQTPREKWLQTRAERTEKFQTSKGTPKETTTQIKEKEPPAKQDKLGKSGSTGIQETVSTESRKTASTRRQKTVCRGLSTGSLKTEQQKRKITGNFS